MPQYSFICSSKLGCGHEFVKQMTMTQYPKSKIKCPHCNNVVNRNYEADNIYVSVKLGDGEIKLGHLAKRNDSRFSDDYKKELIKKNNAYKNVEPNKDLPAGMSRVKKNADGIKEPYKKQRKRKYKK